MLLNRRSNHIGARTECKAARRPEALELAKLKADPRRKVTAGWAAEKGSGLPVVTDCMQSMNCRRG